MAAPEPYSNNFSESIELVNAKPFEELHTLCNEQLLTNCGKPMSPAPEFKANLDPNGIYEISIRIERVSDFRYHCKNGKWFKDSTEFNPPSQNSVKFWKQIKKGSQWMESNMKLNFKITNLEENHCPEKNIVFLTSQYQYQLVMIVVKIGFGANAAPIKTLEFRPESLQFITVTKYRSKEVSALKSSLNKFSSVDAKRKRKQEKKELEFENKAPECSLNYGYPHSTPLTLTPPTFPLDSGASSNQQNGLTTFPTPQPLTASTSNNGANSTWINGYQNPLYNYPMTKPVSNVGGYYQQANYNFPPAHQFHNYNAAHHEHIGFQPVPEYYQYGYSQQNFHNFGGNW